MIYLSSEEAVLAVQGKLTAIVRVMKPQPPEGSKWVGWMLDTTGDQCDIGKAVWYDGEERFSIRSPFIPGAIVQGKETWGIETTSGHYLDVEESGEEYSHFIYKADYEYPALADAFWHSPVTMPGAAVRHRFLIKSVKAMHWNDTHKKPNRWEDNPWIWYSELEAT